MGGFFSEQAIVLMGILTFWLDDVKTQGGRLSSWICGCHVSGVLLLYWPGKKLGVLCGSTSLL